MEMQMRHNLCSALAVVLHDIPVFDARRATESCAEDREPFTQSAGCGKRGGRGFRRRLQVGEFAVVVSCCEEDVRGCYGEDVEEGEDMFG